MGNFVCWRCIISIHAPREGSDDDFDDLKCFGTNISIHAPREGSDVAEDLRNCPGFEISIHAPREGSDLWTILRIWWPGVFQSTLPARGATSKFARFSADKLFQSTLPARGATPRSGAPSTGQNLFQSTLPARGATGADLEPVGGDFDFNPRSPRGERQQRCTIIFLHLWQKG